VRLESRCSKVADGNPYERSLIRAVVVYSASSIHSNSQEVTMTNIKAALAAANEDARHGR